MEEVRRWRVVEVDREEREMEDTRETNEAMDKLVQSEFHEDSTSGQDTSRWIMPYDPLSREVLLWKGTIVARLMNNADLNCKVMALYEKVLVEVDRDGQQNAGNESYEDESESDSDANSGDKSSATTLC